MVAYSPITYFFLPSMTGRNSFHVLVIRSWNERLDHLVKENRYIEALNLSGEFYTDHGKALVGLKGPRKKREKVVSQKMVSILLKFLDISMTKNFPAEGECLELPMNLQLHVQIYLPERNQF